MAKASKNGLLHKNREGHNALVLALLKGAESGNDPINVVKLLLDCPFGKDLIV